MNITNIIDTLRRRKTKNDVEVQVADIKAAVTATLEPLESSRDFLRSVSFDDDSYLKALEALVHKEYRDSRNRLIDILAVMVEGIPERLTRIEKIVGDADSSLFIMNDMTYLDLQCYRMLDNFEFILKYTRWLLVYIMAGQTQGDQSVRDPIVLAPAQARWLTENMQQFATTLHSLDITEKRLKAMLEAVPKVAVDEETAKQTVGVIGRRKLDPANQLSNGFIYQTIYPVREMIEDWRESRRQAAIEERRLLEYMILDLQAQLQNRTDPKIKRALDYQQGRMRSLANKIERMESP